MAAEASPEQRYSHFETQVRAVVVARDARRDPSLLAKDVEYQDRLRDGEDGAEDEVDGQQRALVARADAAEEAVDERQAAQDDEAAAGAATGFCM